MSKRAKEEFIVTTCDGETSRKMMKNGRDAVTERFFEEFKAQKRATELAHLEPGCKVRIWRLDAEVVAAINDAVIIKK